MIHKICRIRHVKCDETHPSCRRCTSTGRKCDGIVHKDHTQFIFTYPLVAFPSMNLNHDEATHLDLFRFALIHKIFDDAGWESLQKSILQAVHSEPAVRYAALALSFANRKRGNMDDALHQYSKSISSLRQLLDSAHQNSSLVDASVICSLLCLSFDVLAHRPQAARMHLESSVNIINHFNGKSKRKLHLLVLC